MIQDLFPLATDGRYVPMLFSRDKVLEAAERFLTLAPVATWPRPGHCKVSLDFHHSAPYIPTNTNEASVSSK